MKSIRAEIISMEKGEHRTFPESVVSFRTVYGYSSELGDVFRRKFMTKVDRVARTITISRLA